MLNLKKAFIFPVSFLMVFAFAFSISSGLLTSAPRSVMHKAAALVSTRSYVQSFYSYPDARHYHLSSVEDTLKLCSEKPSPAMAAAMLWNALFNALFQPIFLSVFIPQVILSYFLFPFFLYGVIKYFRKIPLMIIFFFVFSMLIGIQSSITEALIRHRLICDLIYLAIGSAGCVSLITERS